MARVAVGQYVVRQHTEGAATSSRLSLAASWRLCHGVGGLAEASTRTMHGPHGCYSVCEQWAWRRSLHGRSSLGDAREQLDGGDRATGRGRHGAHAHPRAVVVVARLVLASRANVLPAVGRRARRQPLPHPAALAHVAAQRLDARCERHADEGHDGRQHKRHHLRRLEEHVERRRLAAAAITATATAEPLATAAAAAATAAVSAAAHADVESRRARPSLQRTHRWVELRAACIEQKAQLGLSVRALLFSSCE